MEDDDEDPPADGNGSEPWQLSGIAGWFTYQVWGEIEANFCFPPFFLCFPLYVLFKTVLSLCVFLVIQDAVTHKRTNSDIETDPWHTNHLCSWVGYSEHHQC